jgi:hypothetical protein
MESTFQIEKPASTFPCLREGAIDDHRLLWREAHPPGVCAGLQSLAGEHQTSGGSLFVELLAFRDVGHVDRTVEVPSVDNHDSHCSFSWDE